MKHMRKIWGNTVVTTVRQNILTRVKNKKDHHKEDKIYG